MIFNEIYGCYYNVVTKIIGLAIDGKLTESKMNEIASEYAFEESFLTIVPALKNQDWQLIDHKFETPIVNKPAMPMTTLEKRWLKTILLDPRIALFQIPLGELENVEPLFEPEDIVYFDRYLDGDRYEEPLYIENFHRIRQAIKEHNKVKIKFWNRKNRERTQIIAPIKIEYSDKEDKFRVLSAGRWNIRTINMGRIIQCTTLDETFPKELCLQTRKKDTLIFELTDERDVLERAMMKFAHYKKKVEKVDDKLFQVEMEYDVEDETDVLIQMMSFGSYVKILAPDKMRKELCKRIERQLEMLNW